MDPPLTSRVITVKGILYEYDQSNATAHAPVETSFTSIVRTTPDANHRPPSQLLKYPAMTVSDLSKPKRSTNNAKSSVNNTSKISRANKRFNKLRRRRWFPFVFSGILFLILLIIAASVLIPVAILVLAKSATTTTSKTTVLTTNPSTTAGTTSASTTIGNTNTSTTLSTSTTSMASTTTGVTSTTNASNTSVSTTAGVTTTTATTITITPNTCTSSWSGIHMIASCVNCTYSTTYTQYNMNYTAISSSTYIVFALQRQTDYFALDEVSVTNYASPGVQLLSNGDFEMGNLTSWVYCDQNNASNTGGVEPNGTVNATSFVYTSEAGNYLYVGGGLSAADYLSQAFSTTVGNIYNISLWVMTASTGTTSMDIFLAI